MNFYEAIKAIQRGWKVKRPRHLSQFVTHEGSQVYSSKISIDDLNADDWELVKEEEKEKVKEYTFQEAVSFMKEGKIVRRSSWDKEHLSLDYYKNRVLYDVNKGYVYNLSTEDIEAKDWILVD